MLQNSFLVTKEERENREIMMFGLIAAIRRLGYGYWQHDMKHEICVLDEVIVLLLCTAYAR